jgi:hypothetical protein
MMYKGRLLSAAMPVHKPSQAQVITEVEMILAAGFKIKKQDYCPAFR